jgi:hypothetical protein
MELQMSRKFNQEVSSEMHRFRNENGMWDLDKGKKCFLVRNKTQIHFGNSDNLICTVIMTNPGSYGLDKLKGWNEFESGQGNPYILDGSGYPDPTMRNIIWALLNANRDNLISLEGFIDIYNISSVVCPDKYKAETYHQRVLELIRINNLSIELLLHPVTHNRVEFDCVFKRSPFVIMGFVQEVFVEQVYSLLDWSKNFASKVVISPDKNNWPSHPFRWVLDSELGEKAIQSISSKLKYLA